MNRSAIEGYSQQALDALRSFNEKHSAAFKGDMSDADGPQLRQSIREDIFNCQDPVIATLYQGQFQELFNASSKKHKARLTDRFPDLWASSFRFTENEVMQLRRIANESNASPAFKRVVEDLFGTVNLTAGMDFFESIMPKASDCAEKQPVGLKPEWLWKESRIHEVMDAIQRYKAAEKTIPGEWMVELSELLNKWCDCNAPIPERYQVSCGKSETINPLSGKSAS